MSKALKYYTDEELDAKIKEMEELKERRSKERQKLLDEAKIAYMDHLIESRKDDPKFNSQMNARIREMISCLTSRKDAGKKKALEEFLKLFN